jgi:DNA-directed RNA polymerase subunit RPC12/RpoP
VHLKKKQLATNGRKTMQDKKVEQDSTCLQVHQMSFPMELTCPRCGGEIELWSDEGETICGLCGYLVFGHERFIN